MEKTIWKRGGSGVTGSIGISFHRFKSTVISWSCEPARLPEQRSEPPAATWMMFWAEYPENNSTNTLGQSLVYWKHLHWEHILAMSMTVVGTLASLPAWLLVIKKGNTVLTETQRKNRQKAMAIGREMKTKRAHQLKGKGYSNSEIASKMDIPESTVRVLLKN